jgi:hypothetical protein
VETEEGWHRSDDIVDEHVEHRRQVGAGDAQGVGQGIEVVA